MSTIYRLTSLLTQVNGRRILLSRSFHSVIIGTTSRFPDIIYHQIIRVQTPNQAPISFTKYSTNMAPTPIATYEEIKDLPNHPEKLLIDVRESDELLGGKIPTSINIPLGQVIERLSPETSAEQFQKMFGIRKPSLDSQIIFYCQIGKRSDRAGRMAIDLGYKNVKNYLGSWAEYSKAV